MTDDQDNPGITVPPPLIYLLPLVLGLLLDRRRYIPFLPSGAARGLGWALLGGDVERVVPTYDTKDRCADTHRQARSEADHRRSVPLLPQPQLSRPGYDLRRHCLSS